MSRGSKRSATRSIGPRPARDCAEIASTAPYRGKWSRPRASDARPRRDPASRLVPNTTSQKIVVTPKLPGVLAK